MTRRMLTTATQAEKRRRVASCLNKTSRASGSFFELPELFAGWPTLSQLAHDQNILDIGVSEVVILTGKSKCKPSLTFHCHFFGPWWSLNNMILSVDSWFFCSSGPRSLEIILDFSEGCYDNVNCVWCIFEFVTRSFLSFIVRREYSERKIATQLLSIGPALD